jgi:hypothetical protein
MAADRREPGNYPGLSPNSCLAGGREDRFPSPFWSALDWFGGDRSSCVIKSAAHRLVELPRRPLRTALDCVGGRIPPRRAVDGPRRGSPGQTLGQLGVRQSLARPLAVAVVVAELAAALGLLVVEPGLVVVSLRGIQDPAADSAPDRGQVGLVGLAVGAAEGSQQVGLAPTKPYQTSRMSSTWAARTSPERRRAARSSSPSSSVACSSSSSSRLTGERGTASRP